MVIHSVNCSVNPSTDQQNIHALALAPKGLDAKQKHSIRITGSAEH